MNDTSGKTDVGDIDPISTETASVARAYDFVLGGKDNFEVDRKFAAKIIERDPEVVVSAKLNKAFGRRVTDYMARQGVRQFLDLGSGIPTSPPSIHDTARRVHSDASVVYVDHDPVVVSHNRALRAIGPGLAIIHDSFLNADRIFAHEDLTSNIDLSKPVGVLFLSVLQNTEADKVAEVLADLRSRLAVGSHLAISHISARTSQSIRDTLAEETAAGRYPHTIFRTDEELREFFTGFELVEPGVIDFRDWRPTVEEEDNRPTLGLQFSCGLGRIG